ncbi:hypothetical protein [Streptomyces nanshensis]|uniref:Lipoprotein n=1 Tax=Streptomyces nanshensis TaxID=518642 RepID=A0A1E7KZD0_9ACTN|nr:hypothetical protein [Streptomyces nanshensis]OEV09307.1 hypothetical protein AN218_23010 [Streptomyces nanshensis]
MRSSARPLLLVTVAAAGLALTACGSGPVDQGVVVSKRGHHAHFAPDSNQRPRPGCRSITTNIAPHMQRKLPKPGTGSASKPRGTEAQPARKPRRSVTTHPKTRPGAPSRDRYDRRKPLRKVHKCPKHRHGSGYHLRPASWVIRLKNPATGHEQSWQVKKDIYDKARPGHPFDLRRYKESRR